MSTLDYEYTIEKMPSAIEAIQDIHLKKGPASVPLIHEIAQATGAPQFIEDAKVWERVMELNAQKVKAFCGEEGDKGTETGSLWGCVTIAKTMRRAVGGEM